MDFVESPRAMEDGKGKEGNDRRDELDQDEKGLRGHEDRWIER